MQTCALPVLYQASVPVFLRYLERLDALIANVDAHATATGVQIEDLLMARLAPDMLPFHQQVEIATNFAVRTCFPLCGQIAPPYGQFAATPSGLRARIAAAQAALRALDPAQFETAASRVLQDTAGSAQLQLDAPQFLFEFALPNFFFHVTTAYAILRQRGVALGKRDFDGLHAY